MRRKTFREIQQREAPRPCIETVVPFLVGKLSRNAAGGASQICTSNIYCCSGFASASRPIHQAERCTSTRIPILGRLPVTTRCALDRSYGRIRKELDHDAHAQLRIPSHSEAK